MKTKWFVAAFLASAVLEVRAQVASNTTQHLTVEQWSNPVQTFDLTGAAMQAQQTNQSNQATIQAMELVRATANQPHAPLKQEIELLEEGAIARFGPHHVIFGADAMTPIDLRTPDGQLLRSTVFGLAYFSPDGKQSALIAELKSTEGELLSGNRVLYRNAFEGDVEGDLIYSYTSHSLEQDVVIRKKIAPPRGV